MAFDLSEGVERLAADCYDDARVKLVSLTRLGEEKSAELDSFHREIHRKLLLQMNAQERKHVLSYLEMLHSAMEAVKEQLV